MDSENNPLGEALQAAAAQLPIDAAGHLEQQISEAADAVHAVVDGSGAEEIRRAESHIEAARIKAAGALAELGLAQQALGDYSARLGFGGLAKTSPNASVTPQIHATVDPGIPSEKTGGTQSAQPGEQPAVPKLSPEEQAWFESDADYEESTITDVRDNGDGTYSVITDRSIGETVRDGVRPKVGEIVRQYVTSERVVRGLVVGGRLQHYRSPQEEEVRGAMNRLEISEYDERYMSERYAKLPAIIRERIDFEKLELDVDGSMVDKQIFKHSLADAAFAHRIALKYKTPEAIDTFLSQPFEAQHAQEPDIATRNHGSEPSPAITQKIFEYAKWYLQEAERRKGS